jgi:hypothetical protein
MLGGNSAAGKTELLTATETCPKKRRTPTKEPSRSGFRVFMRHEGQVRLPAVDRARVSRDFNATCGFGHHKLRSEGSKSEETADVRMGLNCKSDRRHCLSQPLFVPVRLHGEHDAHEP